MNGSQNHPYRKRESSNEWSKSTTGEISNGQEGDGNNWKFLNLQLISHFPKRIPSNIVHVMNRIFFPSDSLSVYFSNHLHHHPINPLWAPSDHSFKISLVGQLYGCHSGWQLFFPLSDFFMWDTGHRNPIQPLHFLLSSRTQKKREELPDEGRQCLLLFFHSSNIPC